MAPPGKCRVCGEMCVDRPPCACRGQDAFAHPDCLCATPTTRCQVCKQRYWSHETVTGHELAVLLALCTAITIVATVVATAVVYTVTRATVPPKPANYSMPQDVPPTNARSFTGPNGLMGTIVQPALKGTPASPRAPDETSTADHDPAPDTKNGQLLVFDSTTGRWKWVTVKPEDRRHLFFGGIHVDVPVNGITLTTTQNRIILTTTGGADLPQDLTGKCP